jgi:hypothetical protein
MSLFNLLKVVPSLIPLTLVNQGFVYLGAPAFSFLTLKLGSSISLDETVFSEYTGFPDSWDCLDYLNFSSSFVHNYSEGRGVCRDYSITTFDTYMSLLKLSNRKDLTEMVRFAMGISGSQTHMELEYKQSIYYPYETQVYTPILAPEEVKDYSDKTQSRKAQGMDVVLTYSNPGKKSFYPVASALDYPGGLLGFLYTSFRA